MNSGLPKYTWGKGKQLVEHIQRQRVQWLLRHHLWFMEGGHPAVMPDMSNTKSHRVHRKINGAPHPDLLLSTRQPEEEVIALGAAVSGWVRRMLSAEEIADAFDIPSYCRLDRGWQQHQLRLIHGTVPEKVLLALLTMFSNEELTEQKQIK
eukprot:7592213-Ditylum_brightwellii.AAC.1